MFFFCLGDQIKSRLAKEMIMKPFQKLGMRDMARKLLESGVSVPCVDSVGATKWLNRDDVRKVLYNL